MIAFACISTTLFSILYFLDSLYFRFRSKPDSLPDSSKPVTLDVDEIFGVLLSFAMSKETLEILKNATTDELIRIRDEIGVISIAIDAGLVMELATEVVFHASDCCGTEIEARLVVSQWIEAFIFVRERLDVFLEEDEPGEFFATNFEEILKDLLSEIDEISACLRAYKKKLRPERELGLLYFASQFALFGVPQDIPLAEHRRQMNDIMKLLMREK
ncbi:hypothetical protein L596_029016 [Steinernema carpocapsae]|uniref:Uncharacterized protein n=1 Tax=Steinernema carpocapsae TaxID=34508 RepID=A0A4U5LTD4_STECR|nr:hypothetical protein L596_029016 [Steinernema carpocapsae]